LNPTKDYAGAMTQHSHQTAPTQFVNTAGVRFAYPLIITCGYELVTGCFLAS
jgi:hypothetical protein